MSNCYVVIYTEEDIQKNQIDKSEVFDDLSSACDFAAKLHADHLIDSVIKKVIDLNDEELEDFSFFYKERFEQLKRAKRYLKSAEKEILAIIELSQKIEDIKQSIELYENDFKKYAINKKQKEMSELKKNKKELETSLIATGLLVNGSNDKDIKKKFDYLIAQCYYLDDKVRKRLLPNDYYYD